MYITIIANGFQEDYTSNLLDNLKEKVDKIDLIGSSIHASRNIHPKIRFYNLRGNHSDKEGMFRKIFRTIKYYFKLTAYLLSTDSKIIHIQWFRFHIIEGIVLSLFIQMLRKTVVYTAHDVLLRAKDNTYNRFKFKIIYRVQDRIIVHTSFLKSRLVSEFNVNCSKVHVITHGIYQRNDDTYITKEIARDFLNLSQTATIVLFFGIIAEYKGFDILLKSLSLIDRKHNFQILVAGKVKKDYEQTFYELIKEKKLDNFVFFLRYITDEEIPYCFKASNVTVLPYKEDSQSGVMIMSYAYGIPVIAPSLGGFPEDIVLGRTGYLFEPNNFESLAKALLEFKRECNSNGSINQTYIKEFALSRFSWNRSCDELVQIYKLSKEQLR